MKREKRITDYLEKKRRLLDRHLERFLPAASAYPQAIHRAMRYSVFSGGKRLRPLLTIAAAETQHYNGKAVLPAACALELVHTFSLIHDDLPALDNDDFRRGRSSCHRAFGEDIAVLAGDALLVLAFELLAESEIIGKKFLNPGILIKEITQAIGTGGMIGGQVVDMESTRKKINMREAEYIYEKKTGALITASLRIGGIIGRAPQKELTALTGFGKAMGFCFQIVDDLLDEKKDNEGSSYPSLFGREKALAKVRELTLKAEKSLECLGNRGGTLKAINRMMVDRLK